MKARIIISDASGNTFEGEVELAQLRKSPVSPKRSPGQLPKRTHLADLDSDMPERAFIKSHVCGMSGPKKFVLLLAYMAEGQVGKEVELKDIEAHWNKMTSASLMAGKFNRFYSTTAKENGWVDTTKQGVYVLCPSWKEILE